jgi:hypothetical protein
MRRESLLLCALLLGTGCGPRLAHAEPPASFDKAAAAQPVAGPNDEIRRKIMGEIHYMNDTEQGIFHHDVTKTLAPYFPHGQAMRDTEAVIADHQLGALRKFKGEEDPSEGTMYMTSFEMMAGMGSNVYVVIDFDFDGATRDTMVLRRMKAFVRAKAM